MNTDSKSHRHLTENSMGLGSVTPQMVRQRASELAVINGRAPDQIWQSDLDEAKQELIGEPASEPAEELLELDPEAGAWNPVPGSQGHRMAGETNEDTEDEAPMESVLLVEEGIAEAEHDQMVQAIEQQQREDET
jgi:hypothetical protein